ncbi:hypothetical protein IE81DRAFT_324573 [Ceraceosorus guamensis]|uniref:Uncharacterized protein n=1 Tax=Ceraceosorus guamensis TaxID=1522189 RepID=A0A316VYF8_9BASI|nr:hypothetical protein IE81DRAFT_324573 [Ceraceosorus guamensis]PWN41433.1 hypothetical protein IE81DRAFT_324573 [Ceraceosorus guamensis]
MMMMISTSVQSHLCAPPPLAPLKLHAEAPPPPPESLPHFSLPLPRDIKLTRPASPKDASTPSSALLSPTSV